MKANAVSMQVARRDVEASLEILFAPDDLVELRAIETWTENNKKHSQVVKRDWLRPAEILANCCALSRLNGKGANIFFGVNPRKNKGGKKSSVALCRMLWADIDDPTFAATHAAFPPPTLVVASGRGVHKYWALDKAYVLDGAQRRVRIEGLLARLYPLIGSDSTQDVTRLLRLPGFMNVKEMRNGVPPSKCRIIEWTPRRRYSIEELEASLPVRATEEPALLSLAPFTLPHSSDEKRVRRLAQCLERDVPDRSRRDFAVICGLIRLGIPVDEIWSLVQHHSKFRTNGRSYFDATFAAACRVVIDSRE